jgi:phosphate transport system substrate-binding protein
MNDEFLHALRRDPPPRFATELKRRLDRQSARSRRLPIMRMMAGVLLIGGVAMATALLFRDRQELPSKDVPMAQAPAPKAAARAEQRTSAPRPDGRVTGNGSVTSQVPADEASKDIPVALVTSSLAQPLAQALLERLPKYGYFAQPRVATMDGDGAFDALCGNADLVVASRRISDAALARCRKWGIDVVEWKLGYQAVVLAAGPASDPLALTPRDVFLALAQRIPDPADPAHLIDNPNETWHDVDARFDRRSIEVLVPWEGTSRSLFLQLVMVPGCEATLSQGGRRPYAYGYDVCRQLRSDDHSRDVDLGNPLFAQVASVPNRLVVVDYSFYAAHRRELGGTMLEGPAPTLATLTDGTYPAARPVYVYAQKSHLDWNPAARTLAFELTDEDAVGPQGYLLRQGLVPLEAIPRYMQRTRPPLPSPLESLQP